MMGSAAASRYPISEVRILLFGATGCLGRAIVKQSLVNPEKSSVFPIDSIFFKNLDWEYQLKELISNKGITHIIYAAQSRKYREYPEGLSDVIFGNLLFPIGINAIAQRCKIGFVYCSTGSVYHESQYPIAESHALISEVSINTYIASKIFAEKAIINSSSQRNPLIIRPFYIFGAGATKPNLFPSLRDAVLSQTLIELKGPGGLIFNPISSENAARAILHLIYSDAAGIFNLGGRDVIELREVVNIFSQSLGKKLNLKYSMTSSPKFVSDQTKLLDSGFVYNGNLRQDLKSYAENPN